jgi:HK97 family phage major capsid protein
MGQLSTEAIDAIRKETASALREHRDSRAAVEEMIDARVREEIGRMRAEANAPPPPMATRALADLPDVPPIDPVAGRWYDLAYLEAQVRGIALERTDIRRRHPGAVDAGAEWMQRNVRSLDTETATAGADWTPTAWSTMMIEGIDYATRVAQLFKPIPMTTKQLTVPTETPEDVVVYKVPENVDLTAYNTLIADGGPVTSNISLTADKIGARVIMSTEWEEDAGPLYLQRVLTKMQKSLARGLDDAIVNGDTASPHMDEDITNALDRRKMFLGLRAFAYDIGAVYDLATFTADDFVALRGEMGEYGLDVENCAWIVGPRGQNGLTLLKDAKDNLILTRVSDLGPQATILRGTVGSLFNCPVVFCPKTREDVDILGYYDAGEANDKGTLSYVWRPGWAYGVRRAPRIEQVRHIGAQAAEVVATMRIDFKAALGTEPVAALGYNF